MGVISFLPIAAMAAATMLGGTALSAALPVAEMNDAGFDMMTSAQSIAAAMFLVAGVRLARGRRR